MGVGKGVKVDIDMGVIGRDTGCVNMAMPECDYIYMGV